MVADVGQEVRRAVAGEVGAVEPVGGLLVQLPAPGVLVELPSPQAPVGGDQQFLPPQPPGMGEDEVLPAVAVGVRGQGVEAEPERAVGLDGEAGALPLRERSRPSRKRRRRFLAKTPIFSNVVAARAGAPSRRR